MSESFFDCESKVLLGDYSINYHHRKGSGNEAIVFLHGYPTSSLDFIHVWEMIPERFTLIAHDHLGFGKSDKSIKYSYSLMHQADYALNLYHHLGVNKIHLIGHDYGTSVATEIIARHNDDLLDIELLTVTLSNGSMLIDMAKLRPIQRLLKSKITGPIVARLSSGKIFHRNMKDIWYDKSTYDEQAMDLHWQLLISNNGRKVLPKITRYIDQRYTHYDRWIGALKKTELPIHILWAADDPVAIKAMADQLDSIIANSKKSIIENCGHYPMIEKPEIWIELLLKNIV